MRLFKTAISLLTVGVLGWQCSITTEPTTTPPPSNRTVAELTLSEKNLVESVNRFSFNLFQRVNQSANAEKNVFVSPLSVSYALGIAHNGARGETREEMAAALEIAGFSIDEANRAYQGLTAILTQADSAVIFRIANSFWSRNGKAIKPTFIDVCQDFYNARVEVIDFQKAGAADTINQWVIDNTNGKIKEIIKPPISGDLAALLLNALYLKANWSFPFDTAYTKEQPFYLSNGSQITCPMMYKDTEEDEQLYEEEYRKRPLTYFHNDLFQGVNLPYGKHGFRMTVLLPDSSITADALVEELTLENWEAWTELPTEKRFWLHLPKFKFEFDVRLNDILQAMGMQAAFNGSAADFSNLFVDGIGWIDEVKHKTFVQVDEKGTEAAAVTSISFVDALPPDINVNRPFLFIIHESESGAILFIGKVVNPKLES